MLQEMYVCAALNCQLKAAEASVSQKSVEGIFALQWFQFHCAIYTANWCQLSSHDASVHLYEFISLFHFKTFPSVKEKKETFHQQF